MTDHIDLTGGNLTHMAKAQQALAVGNRNRLTADEIKFVEGCIVDLTDDGQLENHRHYTVLDNLWKKAIGVGV